MGKKCRFYADVMAIHEEVTGSCNIVIVKFPNNEIIRFIVDCGLFQEKKYNELNYVLPFNAKNVEFCLITHAHIDHIGRLPYMVKQGFCKHIYATKQTCELLNIALKNSFKVLNAESKRKKVKCLYSNEDVNNTLTLLKSCEYNKAIPVHDNIKVRFMDNGHLIGAAVILVEISYPGYKNINLLFTGDYNNKNTFFKVNPIPKRVLELPLTVIQESTYGDVDSSQMHKCFKNNVTKFINNNETIIALVFSLGRAQEILYELKTMQEEGTLDDKIPIYFDGKLAIKYTELYIKGKLDIKPEMTNFLPKNLIYVDKVSRIKVLEDVNKKIIVTTSGMGSFGPAQTYIPKYISREKTLIHFTGYTAEGTMGRRLKETKIGDVVEIGGIFIKKRAYMEYTTEYSAHAKADEMIEFLKQFKNLKLVLLNHGEAETKNIFAKRIINEVNINEVGVLGRKYFFRVDSYGLVKVLSTKF